jgi:hypothetical protein
MPQYIVQIARDTLSLSNFGQMLDFFVRPSQLAIHAITFGKERVPGANDDRK